MSNQYQAYQDKMQKTVDVLKHEFTTIRTGRPSAAVLDKVTVDFYGVAKMCIRDRIYPAKRYSWRRMWRVSIICSAVSSGEPWTAELRNRPSM